MNKQMQTSQHFTISINGVPGEEIKPFAKGSVVMIPLFRIAEAMGYSVDHDEAMGVAIMYRNFIYERKTLTVRYLHKGDAVESYYYYHNGEFINEPSADIVEGELYIPLGVFAKIGWGVTMTGSGEINVTAPEKA